MRRRQARKNFTDETPNECLDVRGDINDATLGQIVESNVGKNPNDFRLEKSKIRGSEVGFS
jgi:hypothetical protein